MADKKGLKRDELEGKYDYGNITEKDKKVVEEIIDFLRSREQVPTNMVIEELKTRFQLVEVPMKKIEDSVWGQLTKDEKLGQSVQGFKLTTEDGKKVRIPHIGFSADLNYLDEFVNRLVKKIEGIKSK